MIVCDNCECKPSKTGEGPEIVPITVAILAAGGTPLYKAHADLCGDCIRDIAESIGTPEMIPVKTGDFTKPVAAPEPVAADPAPEPEHANEPTPDDSEPTTDVVSEETAEPETEETESVAETVEE